MRRVGAGPRAGGRGRGRLRERRRAVVLVVGSAVSVTLPSCARLRRRSVYGRSAQLDGGARRRLDGVQGRGHDALAAAQVEAIAGRQRVEDHAADHQRPVAVDLPGVGLGLRAVDDGDRARAR